MQNAAKRKKNVNFVLLVQNTKLHAQYSEYRHLVLLLVLITKHTDEWMKHVFVYFFTLTTLPR